jgi:site-specific recombinase XerD
MKMPTISNPIERFEKEYQSYHSITPGRRADQLRALDSLTRFAGASSPTEVEPEDYIGWLGFLADSELAPSTVKEYGMCARPFYGWAFDARLYSAENLMRIREAAFPKAPPRLPRPYSGKEIKRIWPALVKAHPLDDGRWLKRWRKGTSKFKRIEAHANHLQLRAVIRIALDCGLRRQEIYDLALDDMHYDNAFIVVREGKGEKFREVPYTQAARAAVREWLEFRLELRPTHDRPWLALTRIGPEGVWLRPMHFRRFAIYLGDLGDWQLHRLRHTCATNWLRAGMDIEVLCELLGHSNLSQTKQYVELVRVDVQKQVERYEGDFEAQVAA